MNEKRSTPVVVLCLVLLSVCVACAGCVTASGATTLDPSKSGAEGIWQYLVTNAYTATYTGCTGDAVVLEGANFAEASALAPMCVPAVMFDVIQVGESWEVVPYEVICSDGSGTAGGTGQITGSELVGQWETVSDAGVSATQVFTGSIVGNTITITETARTFSGSFEGSCDLSPALVAIVTVIQ